MKKDAPMNTIIKASAEISVSITKIVFLAALFPQVQFNIRYVRKLRIY